MYQKRHFENLALILAKWNYISEPTPTVFDELVLLLKLEFSRRNKNFDDWRFTDYLMVKVKEFEDLKPPDP